ncbi:hypothetical protein NLG97_g4260 [Lecanicillium saksenae]|uniref:Uncharacterized protein n=1 Tax=Lecanicillium saksenae TaxID=468837 RepID=A0ACC1QYE7_9HYPO|nr:hypothetical protein NLG97_g4260 [Lecanicillium saksenae]
MMRREFSSQRPASSSTPTSATSSSSATTTPTSATTASPAASSPISLRRNRRRNCRLTQRSSSSSSSSSISNRQCISRVQAVKTSTLLARNPALAHKLRQMALPLSPLVQLTTGALESLAAFYHQATPKGARPSPWAAQYPCPVRWRSDAPLEDKRRRMGRFIGLRGCESPVDIAAPAAVAMACSSPSVAAAASSPAVKTEEEIAREARMARLAADDEALRRKTAPGPWGR